MKKYLSVAKLTWDETFTYRLNFTIWRVRSVLSLLTIYFLWFSVLPKGSNLLGYTQDSILTYIIGAYFVGAIVFSSRTPEIGDNINSGDLSIFLLRPINYFFYWFAKDAGDKAMNIFFSIFELILFFIVIHPPLFIQTNIFTLFLSIIAIIFSTLILFWINVLLGLIGFWSQETWAPRFIFYTLVPFLSGVFFPLDIVPGVIFSIIKLLPFTYLLYFPVKIYLGQLVIVEIILGFGVSLVWVIILQGFAQFVWKKGLRSYVAYGR